MKLNEKLNEKNEKVFLKLRDGITTVCNIRRICEITMFQIVCLRFSCYLTVFVDSNQSGILIYKYFVT